MDLITIIGARPQFIKAAITSRELRKADINETIVHTGQHYDRNMSDIFVEEFGISTPNYLLNKSQNSAPTSDEVQEQLIRIIKENKPNAIIVYGDTDSTLAGAIAGKHCNIPVIHIEAGLRSFNSVMREERNRIETDHISSLLFAPTDVAVLNLKKDPLVFGEISQCGDVMYDLFLETAQTLVPLTPNNKKKILVTTHRAENVDIPNRLKTIFDSMIQLSEKYSVLLPLHPRTRKRLEEAKMYDHVISSDISLLEPIGYKFMVEQLISTDLVCTDSGGLQKEAFFAKKPCVTIRDETEWVELVEAGWNVVCPPDSIQSIVSSVEASMETTGNDIHPYGTGQSAAFIAASIRSFLNK